MGARLVAASFGGICIGLSFPPAACWPAVFVGVTLLLRASAGAGYTTSFFVGWLGGCAGYAVAGAWLWSAIARFTGGSRATVAACVAACVAYHAAQFGLFSLLAPDHRGRNLPRRCLGVAAVWVVIEWGFPKILPWTLGDGLVGSLLMRQAADLAGAHGLSFAIVSGAAALAASTSTAAERRERLHAAVAASCLVIFLAIYGVVRVMQLDLAPSPASLRVTLVQGGLGLHADARRQNDLAWRIYEPLTRAAAARRPRGGTSAALTIWPEATLRAYLHHDMEQRRRVRRLAALLDQALLVGALDLPASGAGELNAAYLIAAGRRFDAQTYHKRALFPFGEYVPGADWIRPLRAWRTVGRFVRGEAAAPLEAPGGWLLAPAICFEALHPGGFNRMVHDGARLLVNLSDDAWFAGTNEVAQSLGVSSMRAVETRRWLARASDSGVSAFVDPAGRVVSKLDEGVIGAITADVPARDELSPYVRHGDWIVGASVLGLIVAGVPRNEANRKRATRRVGPRLVESLRRARFSDRGPRRFATASPDRCGQGPRLPAASGPLSAESRRQPADRERTRYGIPRR